jgi:hypothetical protein
MPSIATPCVAQNPSWAWRFLSFCSSLTGASATLKLFAVNRFISFIDV